MAPADLGQKMRETLQATLPDEDVALGRVARRRALRAIEQQAERQGANLGWLPNLRWQGVGSIVGIMAAVLVAVGLGWFWTRTETASVSIGPSLTRDLELRPRGTTAAEARADDRKSQDDGTAAAHEADRAAVRARSAARATKQGLPGPRAPLSPTPADATDTDARWARVTEAMRKRDWEAAKLALAPLSDSSDPETKDSARLVRIRLELGASRDQTLDPRWQAELSELAASGSTSSIRASARRLLEDSKDAPNKQSESSREPLLEEN